MKKTNNQVTASEPFVEFTDERLHFFDWREYYHAVRDRFWIVLLCLVLGVAGAVFGIRRSEETFRAKAVLFLGTGQGQVMSNIQGVGESLAGGVEMMNTISATLNSYPFALRVAERLQLANDPRFRQEVEASGMNPADLTPASAATRLPGMVFARHAEETRLIEVISTTRSGELSVMLANAYVEEYLRLTIERSTESARSAGQLLVDEAERLAKRMRLAEEAMQSFRERERASSLDTMMGEAQGRVNELAAEQTEIEKKIKQIDADLVTSEKNRGDLQVLLRLPSIAAEPQIVQQTEALLAQETELDVLRQRYRAGHPQYEVAEKRLNISKDILNERLDIVLGRLGSQRDLLLQRLEIVKASREQADERLLEVTRKSIEYNSLSRELDAERALHAAVLKRLKEVDLTQGVNTDAIRIHERALGAQPVPIPMGRMLLLGIFGGASLGIAIALAINTFDPTIRNPEQAERWSGHPVIATIPEIKSGKKSLRLVVAERREALEAEAFRTLRTSVAMVGDRSSHQTFLFTSALPSEGKTFVSSNFAASLAQQGFQTILVDMDLRKPAVSPLFYGGEHLKPGLTDLLLGECSLEEAVKETTIPNLWVITAGSRSENASELLAERATADFLKEIREKYERVVLDTAPVIPVSDTLLLVGFSDVNCLVSRAGKTPRKSVEKAVRLLTEFQHPPAGVILNRLKRTSSSYYYSYHGSYYGYSDQAKNA